MINQNSNWIDTVKMSLPAHASVLENNLVQSMTKHTLSEVDAHACALAAAIASGNNELAFEISVNGVLFGNDVREIVTRVVISQMMDTITNEYIDSTYKGDANTHPFRLERDDVEKLSDALLYAYAAALVLRNGRTFAIVDNLKAGNYTDQQIQDVANIAATVAAISKAAI